MRRYSSSCTRASTAIWRYQHIPRFLFARRCSNPEIHAHPRQHDGNTHVSEHLRRRGRPASAIYAPIPRFPYPSRHNNSKIRAHPRQRGTNAHPKATPCTSPQTGPPEYRRIPRFLFAIRGTYQANARMSTFPCRESIVSVCARGNSGGMSQAPC